MKVEKHTVLTIYSKTSYRLQKTYKTQGYSPLIYLGC